MRIFDGSQVTSGKWNGMAQDGTSGKSSKSKQLDLIWSSPFCHLQLMLDRL
jgi:hypothetical protein